MLESMVNRPLPQLDLDELVERLTADRTPGESASQQTCRVSWNLNRSKISAKLGTRKLGPSVRPPYSAIAVTQLRSARLDGAWGKL